jgi:two-component system sensor histidine kinase KdpD
MRRTAGYAAALGGPPLLAVTLRPLAHGDQATNVAFAFLLLVLVVSLAGLGPGVAASLTAFVAFDLGFVQPYGALTVRARHDVGVLAGFLGVALVVSALVSRLSARREQAERKAEEARLMHLLADTDDVEAFVRDELGATSVRVVHGPPPPGTSAVATLADGGTVSVVAEGTHHPSLLDAVADRVAANLDRERLLAESRERELLERSEQERAALVSGVSHDLRTPLAAIKASASALTQAGEHDREALAASIGVEVDRLDRMVRNLLAVGRIESGRLVAKPESVPLDELVGSVLARLRPYLRERRLELDVPEALPPAYVDPVQGEQAFGNLVENVIAHTPLNAGLIVRAGARAEWVTIRVADEGPGIPEHEQRRIFERFGRGSHAGPGSGLGLAIARAYAEANGGGLDVAPTNGCGAAFELWLPAATS